MDKIAMAFSGGGFRAAAFSLGTLSYLNELPYKENPFLHRVTFISSASGGSITNSLYSLHLAQNRSFSETFHQLLSLMEGETLLSAVFKILKTDSYWLARPHKSRNLINAFSIAYDEILFNQSCIGELSDGLSDKHLDQICINATEFANGMSFRFQSQDEGKGKKNGEFGNYYIHLRKDPSRSRNRIRLGDILACSSCFPAGFEPFLFPRDFTHPELTNKTLHEILSFRTNPFTTKDKIDYPFKTPQVVSENSFALMDGGIADNQGIESLQLANERQENEFDLFIITDVTSYFLDGYQVPSVTTNKKSPSLYGYLWWTAALLSTYITLIIAGTVLNWKAATIVGIFLLPFLIIFIYGVIQLSAFSKKIGSGTWGLILKTYGKYFFRIPFHDLIHMIRARLKSVFLMTSDIYLKQIRRQYYKHIFKNSANPDKIVTNAIYDLSKLNNLSPEEVEVAQKELKYDPSKQQYTDTPLVAGEKLKFLAERATKTPTTLWFDKNHKESCIRETVTVTGQFTICYNLITYLESRRNAGAREEESIQIIPEVPMDTSLSELEQRLRQDWQLFNEDPFWLYNLEVGRFEGYPELLLEKTDKDWKIVEKHSKK